VQLRPHAAFNDGERFVSPPPFAWLVLPLSLFGAAGAVYAWLAISVAALGMAWCLCFPLSPDPSPLRGEGALAGLFLLGALAWYPVLYGLSLAQPDLVIVLIAAVAWRLAEANKPYLAGAVLGLSVIKPQLTLLLPLVLLFGGRWKIAAAWAGTAAVLALASLAAVGSQGLGDYLSLLNEAQHVTNNRYFTLAFVLGPGALSYVAQALVAVAAAAGAYLNRHASHARVFALGIVATSLGATYWHLQDFTVLVLAAWLFWRGAAPTWQRWWLLVIAVAAEFAWPLSPLPLLLTVLVWFAAMIAGRPARLVAASAR